MTKQEESNRAADLRAEAKFAQLVEKVQTIDGISTGDAMQLGSMIREYGDIRASAATSAVLGPVFEAMLPKPNNDKPKNPWEV